VADETASGDLDLFDAEGKAVAYIHADDGLIMYLWSGEPVAYLVDDSVYGFNGKHLGWFQKGAVYDDDGDIVAALATRFRGSVQRPPIKSLRSLKPLKGLKELKPLKPLFGLSWSKLPAKYFFLQGLD
jgi:hypothetical protein